MSKKSLEVSSFLQLLKSNNFPYKVFLHVSGIPPSTLPLTQYFAPTAFSETQGQIVAQGKVGKGKKTKQNKRWAKKSQEQNEKRLGTTFLQSSSKQSRPFWLLIGRRKRLHFSAESACSKSLSSFRVFRYRVVHEVACPPYCFTC